jgi:hypothetical protein
VRIDFATRRYSFRFEPDKEFEFQRFDFSRHPSRQFPCSEDAFWHLTTPCLQAVPDSSAELDKLIGRFPGFFSDEFGTVKGMICHLDLVDSTPVGSRPYHCSPPRLRILRKIVQDLIDKGVVTTSYSQYASPAFSVPKPNSGNRVVVDYRILNEKWSMPLRIFLMLKCFLFWN